MFQRQCGIPFLSKDTNEKGEEYDVADYEDIDDLMAKVKSVRPAMYTLLPGFILYAIILKHISDDGDQIDNQDFNYVYENYVVLQFGGDVLLSLFNEEYGKSFSDYEDVLEYAFRKAGLYIEGQYGATQAGGFGDGHMMTESELDSMMIGVPFPRDLIEASSWNDRMDGTLFVSAPESVLVQEEGITARVPPAVNMNYVDRPMVAPVFGGGGRKTTSAWFPGILATVTVAMAFLQSYM